MINLLNAFYYLTGWLILIAGGVLALVLLAPVWLRRSRERRVRRQVTVGTDVRTVRLVDMILAGQETPEYTGYRQVLVPVYLPVMRQAEMAERTPAAPAVAGEPPATVYRISSSTLAAAFRYLMRRLPDARNSEPEWMLAVTGLRLPNGERTLESLVEIRLNRQSAVQASFDMQDFTQAAVTMHMHGQALHAVFHSHRFAGHPGPSGVDLALQRQLEAGGYPAIQAVFSEDGYVRFFGGQRPWEIEVYGRGALRLADDLWQIVERDVLPTPASGREV